jgi:hypothetical protein
VAVGGGGLTARQASLSEVVVWPGGRRWWLRRLWCLLKRWLWKACPILLPRLLVGRDESSPEPKGARRQWCGRRPKSGEAEGRRMVRPKSNVPMKPYREGLSRLGFRRRCRRSRTEGGGGPVASKVVCLSGERRWGDGRDEDVGATTQNRAKSEKEQPETEHRHA